MRHHSSRRKTAAAALLLALFPPLALAQDDASEAALALRLPRVPIHTAEPDLGTAYGVWAAGDGYKASFHDGMTFVPYLGPDYPHNQPWSWHTLAVTAGELELVTPGAIAEHWHSDYRYEYRYGAVTEAYDVLHPGLEQSFVVHAHPGNGGDLVVRGAVSSACTAADTAPTHAALTFADTAGTALIGYGRAFAIDATGRRLPIATAFRNGEITLTVPAAWLANATFPVTVDPLLSRVVVGFGNGSARSVDIGQDDRATSNNIMLAYVHAASQFDDDVRAVLCDVSFANANLVYSDITTSWDSDSASCAFVGGAARWVIALRRYFGGSSLRVSQLRCHAHSSGDATFHTGYGSLAPPTGFNDWRPDVGGVDAFASGNHALVVFQHENNGISPNVGHFSNTDSSELWGVRVDATTTNGTFLTPTRYLSGVGADAERPAVNQMAEGGSTFIWLCAGQLYYNNVNGRVWDVYASRIRNDGQWLPGFWTSAFAGPDTHHQLGPRVDGQDGRYAITYATASYANTPTKTSNTLGEAIQVERLDWSIPQSNWRTLPVVELVSSTSRDFEVGGIAFDNLDRSHFAIGYRWWYLGSGPYRTMAMRIGYRGELTEGPLTLYGPPGIGMTNTAVIWVDDYRRFLFGYAEVGTSNNLVYGHGLDYTTPPGRSVTGFGCSAAQIDWNGNRQIGAQFNEVTVSGAPAGTVHFLFASLGTADQAIVNPAVASGCRLLVDNGAALLGTMQLKFGADVAWTFPLPEWLTPVTFHFQDWTIDNGLFESTRRLSVPVVK
ncbi:MAG: hypothetical protein KDE27_26715 [Planctomycetes bacterium]|nr:hypothetical protein [Planctomycetota bacterium]